ARSRKRTRLPIHIRRSGDRPAHAKRAVTCYHRRARHPAAEGSMFLLPAKIGPFTLMRRLGSNGVTEEYSGILDDPAGAQVLVHRLVPSLAASGLVTSVEARVRDLMAIRHPTLVPVLAWEAVGADRFVVEEW